MCSLAAIALNQRETHASMTIVEAGNCLKIGREGFNVSLQRAMCVELVQESNERL